MARVIDENLRRHWNLVLGTCIKYYPARLKVGAEQAADREKMYRFKDGTDQEEAARWTASQLASRFGDKVRSIVFACIPASSAEKNRIPGSHANTMRSIVQWNVTPALILTSMTMTSAISEKKKFTVEDSTFEIGKTAYGILVFASKS